MGERQEGQPVQNLEDINFDIELADENEQRKSETQTIPATFNGKTLELRVNKHSVLKKDEDITYADLRIFVYKERKEIGFLTINITRQKNGSCGSAGDIANYRQSELPGLGRALWELKAKFIQKMANEWGIEITDHATKAPTDGLSSKKWDEIFLPLLEKKYGYSPTGKKPVLDHGECDTWEKKYSPQPQDA